MVYIFHVDEGRMIVLDVNYVAGPVQRLQTAIVELTGIPMQHQVLLVSGGEILDPNKAVSHYGAGTDSNPIFLASRHIGDPQSTSYSEGTAELEQESIRIRDEVSSVCRNALTFESVQILASLARQAATHSDNTYQLCKRLVDEQHFLHQGWSALVANLEDSVETFARRSAKFRNHFQRFVSSKDKARELLKSFSNDVEILAQIPLPLCLISEELRKRFGEESKTLLDWISASDPEHNLEDMAREVEEHLDRVENLQWTEFEDDAKYVDEQATRSDYKEIKGISKRLGQLDEYLNKAETMLTEQKRFSEAVIGLEQRALGMSREQSNLSEIRNSQSIQLNKMMDTQGQIVEIASRFNDSKMELLNNIRRRLSGWISDTYRSLHVAISKIQINGELLSNLRKRLEVLRQLHETPTIYAAAVCEVLRRKSFRSEFMDWASCLTEKTQWLRDEETELRDSFQKKLEKHFLRALFPGMSDAAPDFATEMPPPFDDSLPPLEADHLRALRKSAPTVANLLQVKKSEVYSRLSVEDPNSAPGQIGGTLRREASFFCHSAPKFIMAARSFPSTTWLSGDENLEISPHNAGGFGNTPPPPSKIEFARLGGFESPSPLAEEPPSAVGGTPEPVVGSARSAPIRIPSRAPSDGMSTSRQMSEKSSRFGTPEEDLPASSGELGPSPPVLISKSELKDEVSHLTAGMVARVARINADPTVDPLAEPSDSLFPGASASEITIRKSSESSQEELTQLKKDLEDKDAHLKALQTELAEAKAAKQRIEEDCQKLKSEHQKSVELIKKQSPALAESATTMKKELEELRKNASEFSEATSEAGESLSKMILDAYSKVVHAMNEQTTKANEEALAEIRREMEAKISSLETDIEVEKSKGLDAEEEVRMYHDQLEHGQKLMAALEEKMTEERESWAAKVEEAKHEIYKQLTIDHELQLDALREGFKLELQECEAQLEVLKDELREKDSVLSHQRKEHDSLVASICDRDQPSVDVASQEKLRTEIEREFRDKLQFLTKGMEEKRSDAVHRAEKAKEVELRILKEKYEAELAAKDAEHSLAIAELHKHAVSGITKETNTSAVERLDKASQTELELEEKGREEEKKEGSDSGDSDEAVGDAQLPASEATDAAAMYGSVMTIPAEMSESVMTTTGPENSPKHPSFESMSTNLNEKNIQTALRLKDLKGMISVAEIKEGDPVLVVWDEAHNSYVVFTTGSTLHFVKETFVKKMGLMGSSSSGSSSPRKNWSLAQITKKVEYCQIKKENNRYRLPMGVKFFRVEAERLDMRATSNLRSSAAPTPALPQIPELGPLTK